MGTGLTIAAMPRAFLVVKKRERERKEELTPYVLDCHLAEKLQTEGKQLFFREEQNSREEVMCLTEYGIGFGDRHSALGRDFNGCDEQAKRGWAQECAQGEPEQLSARDNADDLIQCDIQTAFGICASKHIENKSQLVGRIGLAYDKHRVSTRDAGTISEQCQGNCQGINVRHPPGDTPYSPEVTSISGGSECSEEIDVTSEFVDEDMDIVVDDDGDDDHGNDDSALCGAGQTYSDEAAQGPCEDVDDYVESNDLTPEDHHRNVSLQNVKTEVNADSPNSPINTLPQDNDICDIRTHSTAESKPLQESQLCPQSHLAIGGPVINGQTHGDNSSHIYMHHTPKDTKHSQHGIYPFISPPENTRRPTPPSTDDHLAPSTPSPPGSYHEEHGCHGQPLTPSPPLSDGKYIQN